MLIGLDWISAAVGVVVGFEAVCDYPRLYIFVESESDLNAAAVAGVVECETRVDDYRLCIVG